MNTVGSSSDGSTMVMNPESLLDFTAVNSYCCEQFPNLKNQENGEAVIMGKEAVTCSDCSDVIHPEKFDDFPAEFPCESAEIVNLKKRQKKRKRVRASNLDLGAGVKVEFFSVPVNGAPFFDFFAKEVETDFQRDAEIDKADVDVPVIKRRKVVESDSHLKNPGEKQNTVSPSSSFTYSNSAPAATQNTVSDSGNSDKGKGVDSSTPVGSDDELISSFEGGSCSGTASQVPLDVVPLSMYYPESHPAFPSEDIEWTVKKTLTASDCSPQQNRLLITRKAFEEQILCHLDDASQLEVSTPNGLRVDVLDCDVGLQVKLTLKKWSSSKCYLLNDNWNRSFVEKRKLKPKDEIGLCWDKNHNRLLFSVLRFSPKVDQTISNRETAA